MNDVSTRPDKDQAVQIELDGINVTAPRKKLNGIEIRELGDANRVNGFETQEIDKKGKKIRTIPDDKETELHEGERFRTVPNQGGPGAGA
ncbi:MAG: hypothetical protein JWR19_4116 [Pedosphaera sp.]|nr:hypothetical protein [Pedosphaera sp.]